MVKKFGKFYNNPFHESQNCGTESPIDNECNSPSTSLVRDNMVYLQIYDQVYFEVPDPNGGDAYPDCTLASFYAFARVEIERLHDICPNHISRLREKWLFPVSLFEHFEQQQLFFGTSTNTFDNSLLNATLWISQETYNKGLAIYGVLSTLYITLLLGVMAFLFSRDMDNLVIRPIETMVDSVTRLAANPAHKLEAVKTVKYETDALRVSLNKIAQLLQVGFGEAGNNLVAENLKKGDTVDPMVPGKKLLGAYGFCIIDYYEEVLECLGEEILPFTNMAAKVLHEAVTYNGGQPNRNLGDAFLCVWKPQARLLATPPHSRVCMDMCMHMCMHMWPCSHTRPVTVLRRAV
jgi:hypothetical protein